MIGAVITPADVAYARNLARQTVKRHGFASTDLDDAVGVAMVALCECARRWRPEGGATFRSYAFTRIRGAIVDAHRSTPGNSRAGGEARRGTHVSLDKDRRGTRARQDDSAQLLEALEAIQAMAGKAGELMRRRIEGDTLLEAGAAIGLSKSWACRIEQGALAELRRGSA